MLTKQPTGTTASEIVGPASPSPTGSLYINPSPSDAAVVIDGIEVAGTNWPRTIGGLSAGSHDANHRVRISSDRFYLPHEQIVTLTAGHTLVLSVTLEARDVAVTVQTSLGDATIKLVEGNGVPIPVARDGEAFRIRRLPGVPYKLIVEHVGHEPVERLIAFSGDHVENIDLDFGPGAHEDVAPISESPPTERPADTVARRARKPRTTELKIGSGRALPPAIVWIDGVRQSRPTPLTIEVTSGVHTLKWRYPDGRFTVKKITLEDGDSTLVNGTL